MKKIIQNPYFIILGLALIIRILLFFIANAQGENVFYLFDSYRYLNLGENFIEHGTYSETLSNPLFPSIFIPPGSPILFHFLKSIGGIQLIIFFQIICQLISCYILLKIIEKIFEPKSKLFLFVGGFLFALDIPTLVLGNVIMTETVFTTLLLLSIYHLISFIKTEKLSFLFFSSLFLGLSALFRPIIYFFPLFILAYFIFHYKKEKKIMVKSVLYFFLPFYLITGVWVIRNYVKHDTIFFSYQSNFNLFYYQASSIYSQNNSIGFLQARIKLFEELKKEFPGQQQIDQIEFYDKAGEKALSIILSHPLYFLKNMAKANVNLFLRPVRDYLKINFGSNELFHTRSKNNSLFIKLIVIWQVGINLLTLLLIPFGFFYFYHHQRKLFWLFFLFLAYFVLVCSGPEVEARFRVPIIPELIILAIAGIYQIKEKIFTKKTIASVDNSTFAK